MDTDLVLTLGIVLLVLTLPSLLASWVEGRAPRMGAIMLVASLSLIVAAVVYKPGGYAVNDVPEVMVGVLARMIN
jgi:formate-dependent nitrite reductase membrane component NrfD